MINLADIFFRAKGRGPSHPTHRWCTSCQRPPTRELAETDLVTEPYGFAPPPLAASLEKRRRDRFLYYRPVARPNEGTATVTDQPKSTFARRVRAAKPRAKKYEIRDDEITGLGLAVQLNGVRTFVLNRMVRGRRRYATVGPANAMTVPEASAEARRLIAAFLDSVKNDGGPKTPGHPMDAFAAEFLDRQARHWKPRTLESNTYMVRKYILPAFGHLTVDAIAVEHVRDWFASMADRPGAANRAMPILSVMMRMAELWGYRPHNSNPCKNTRRYRMKPTERFLTADEMARLNAVLTRDEFYCPRLWPSSAC